MTERTKPDSGNDDEIVDAMELLAGDAVSSDAESSQTPLHPATPRTGPPRQTDDGEIYSIAPPLPAPPPMEMHDPQAARASARGRSTGVTDIRVTLCPNCGYILHGESDYRCSECGRQFDAETIERWFGGDEGERFDRVVWITTACLFIKLWFLLPAIAGIARPLHMIGVGIACFLASNGKTESTAGMYGMVGVVTAVLAFLSPIGWGVAGMAFYTTDMVLAALLLCAMLSDPKRIDVFGSEGVKRIAIGVLLAAPIFALAMTGAMWVAANSGNAWLAEPDHAALIFSRGLPFLANLGVWIFVWLQLRRIQKILHPSQGATPSP